VGLYDVLVRFEPTPVARLNRALALAERDGPAAGLAEIEPLAERLDRYHLFHAARAELLRRLGRDAEARTADRQALELTDNPAERRLLAERIGDTTAP
jgi:RNA polymerase sigma-70 factor (ECF subfamily)